MTQSDWLVYHALIKLVLYVVRFTARNLEAAQSLLDVLQ